MAQEANDALSAGRLGLGAYQAYKAAPGILEGIGQFAKGDFSSLANLNFANMGANLGIGLLSGSNPYHSTGGQAAALAGTLAGSFIPVPGAGFLIGKGLGSIFDRKSVGPGGTWGFDFRTGQPTGLSGDNGMKGEMLADSGSAYADLLGQYAAKTGGRLNLDTMQLGWQPQQGQPQIAFHLPGGKVHTDQIYDDEDVLRSALRSGAIDVSETGRTWQDFVNDMGPSYLEKLWAKQQEGPLYYGPGNVGGNSEDTGMGTANAPADVGIDGGDGVGGDGWKRGGLVHRYATGGYLDGPDDGMADTVPATIEGQDPAALSHGEFVMPADVVAALGDGNSKAGAKKLDGLISLLRQKKYGRDKQPPPVGLPALLKRAKIV